MGAGKREKKGEGGSFAIIAPRSGREMDDGKDEECEMLPSRKEEEEEEEEIAKTRKQDLNRPDEYWRKRSHKPPPH